MALALPDTAVELKIYVLFQRWFCGVMIYRFPVTGNYFPGEALPAKAGEAVKCCKALFFSELKYKQ